MSSLLSQNRSIRMMISHIKHKSFMTEELSADIHYFDHDRKKVIVIDRMALVNRVREESEMKTWKVNNYWKEKLFIVA